MREEFPEMAYPTGGLEAMKALSTMERAAVMSGRVDYFAATGGQVRAIDVAKDYYATNRGETFPGWVQGRVVAGALRIVVWSPHRESML